MALFRLDFLTPARMIVPVSAKTCGVSSGRISVALAGQRIS